MERDNLLEIKDLHIQYDTMDATFYAVNGVNLHLKKGETLGLVGETGAGKTTTALGILNLLPKGIGKITQGDIQFDGSSLISLSKKQMRAYRGKKISMIFQDPMTSLNPVITVGDQIAEVLKLHNTDNLSAAQISEKVEEMLQLVGISPERKNDYPHQFSGGMKQRVVIAISLACKPQLLIADEPTTALDVTIQAQVLALMTDLKETLKTSILMITHDFGVVAETCDRVAVMYAGIIVESGTVEDIFEGTRKHPYTEGLMASIPSLDVETERLSPIAGDVKDPTEKTPGCPFAPRCPYAKEECFRNLPEEKQDGSHMIRCSRDFE